MQKNKMDVLIGDVGVRLAGNAAALQQAWQRLFVGWPHRAVDEPEIIFALRLVDELTDLPSGKPLYSDVGVRPAGEEIVAVYEGEAEQVWLHFFDGGLVGVPLAQRGRIVGQVTRAALKNGRFEDIIFTSLAVMLRRRGLFAVHAFAAAKEGQAILLVGASQSGKTTTGLNLLLNGWRLLANDVVLLRQQENGVWALPAAGEMSIRPPTYDLLPALRKRRPFVKWGEASRVTAVFFPQVQRGVAETAVVSQPRALALAQLMSESVDRWDVSTLDNHVTILENLTKQSQCYQLLLGQEMKQIPAKIADRLT